VFLEILPHGYSVYIFYYPGAFPNDELENKLRTLGKITGNIVFVNIGRLNDPRYEKIRDTFSITDLRVIVITAIEELASIKADSRHSTSINASSSLLCRRTQLDSITASPSQLAMTAM